MGGIKRNLSSSSYLQFLEYFHPGRIADDLHEMKYDTLQKYKSESSLTTGVASFHYIIFLSPFAGFERNVDCTCNEDVMCLTFIVPVVYI